MRLDWLWIEDPKTKVNSVSLSLVVYVTPIVLAMAVLAGFEIVAVVTPILTVYGLFLSLYFGRRIKVSKDYVELAESVVASNKKEEEV